MRGFEPTTFCMASELRRSSWVATCGDSSVFWPNPCRRGLGFRRQLPPLVSKMFPAVPTGTTRLGGCSP
jgi:hypothetical protein